MTVASRAVPPAPQTIRTPTPPDGLIKHRLAACVVCPNYSAATGKCRMLGCGCVVTDWVRRPWGRCPDGRWNL